MGEPDLINRDPNNINDHLRVRRFQNVFSFFFFLLSLLSVFQSPVSLSLFLSLVPSQISFSLSLCPLSLSSLSLSLSDFSLSLFCLPLSFSCLSLSGSLSFFLPCLSLSLSLFLSLFLSRFVFPSLSLSCLYVSLCLCLSIPVGPLSFSMHLSLSSLFLPSFLPLSLSRLSFCFSHSSEEDTDC